MVVVRDGNSFKGYGICVGNYDGWDGRSGGVGDGGGAIPFIASPVSPYEQAT